VRTEATTTQEKLYGPVEELKRTTTLTSQELFSKCSQAMDKKKMM
jgi:hypothetical protein